MGRGRKPNSKGNTLNWQEFFNRNVGSYLQIISNELSYMQNEQGEGRLTLLKKIEKEKERLLTEKKLRINSSNPKTQILGLRYKIPNNWNWFLLSDVAFYQEGPGIRTYQYRTEGVKLLNVQNITQDKLRLDLTTRYISYEEYEQKYKHFKIQEGDILFASSGGSWGKTCWYEGFDKDLILNTSTMRIRTFSEKVLLNNYLYLFLKTDFFRKQLIPQLMGMQPNFGSTHFNSISIPVPPVSLQRKILQFLYDFENIQLKSDVTYFNERVEKTITSLHQSQLVASQITSELTRQLDLVKKLRQQLLQDAVQGKLVPQNLGDEPASELLKKIKVEKEKFKKESALPPIKAEEIPFNIPKNWVFCRLGEICTKIGSGSTPKGSDYSIQGMPFFRSQNIYEKGLIYDDIKFISAKVHKKMNGTIVYSKDILLNITGGSLGRSVLVPEEFEEGNVSQHVCIIRPIGIDNNYCYKVILSPFFQGLIFSSTTGAGREGLPKYNLEQFLIPLPPLSEQSRILQKLEYFLKTCDDLDASIKQSQQQNKQLLQQVLREALNKKVETEVQPVNKVPVNEDEKYKVLLLAAEIIWQLNQKQTLGHVKLQKLIYLCERTQQMNLPVNFLKKAMGPYDRELQLYLDKELQQREWFSYNEDEPLKYKMLKNAGGHKAHFKKYFEKDIEAIYHLISLFEDFTSAEIEIVATLYACREAMLKNNQLVNDTALLAEFYDWSESKTKHKEDKVIKGLRWMEGHGIVPK